MEQNIYKINNVAEYVDKISELNEKSKHMHSPSVSSLTFYRGQAYFNWGLTPKLYREGLFKKEGVLVSEFLRIAPKEFEGMSYFDILVKMQHYGLPTRLLDTTQNPLVALFFACYDNDFYKEDGAVFAFHELPVNKPELNHISLIMKFVFEYSGFKLDIEEFTKDVVNSKEMYTSYAKSFENSDEVLHILINVPFYAILPTLNNPRIVNQDGTFLLFGMDTYNKIRSANLGTLNKLYYQFAPKEFKSVHNFWKNSSIFCIPSNAKKVILKELELLGITRNKMLPELEYQAEFITASIKKDVEKNS